MVNKVRIAFNYTTKCHIGSYSAVTGEMLPTHGSFSAIISYIFTADIHDPFACAHKIIGSVLFN